MIEWISKSHRKNRKKEEQELVLRKSLAEKLSRLESVPMIEYDDHTEFMLDGRIVTLLKEEITITGIDPEASKQAAMK
ncbi:MAG: hypothetical protein ACI9LO_001117 [Planctomycetota bacterium]|jgi:hypothetical protein